MSAHVKALAAGLFGALMVWFYILSPDVALAGLGSRSVATAYADRYSNNWQKGQPGGPLRDSHYYSFGEDCTNFASAIINQGGWPEQYNGPQQWVSGSYDWVNIVGLLHYMWYANMGSGMHPITDLSVAYTPAWAGDLFVYDWGNGGGVQHAETLIHWGTRDSMYARYGSGDYTDSHTSERHHSPWNLAYLSPPADVSPARLKIWWIHVNYAD